MKIIETIFESNNVIEKITPLQLLENLHKYFPTFEVRTAGEHIFITEISTGNCVKYNIICQIVNKYKLVNKDINIEGEL